MTVNGYTHGDWKMEMAAVLGLDGAIYKALDEMLAVLRGPAVRAGRTHLKLVASLQKEFADGIAEGAAAVGVEDAHAIPVHEAIQRVGGLAEVAREKRYHER